MYSLRKKERRGTQTKFMQGPPSIAWPTGAAADLLLSFSNSGVLSLASSLDGSGEGGSGNSNSARRSVSVVSLARRPTRRWSLGDRSDPSLRRRRSAGSVRCSTERRLVALVGVLGGPDLSAPQTAVTHVIACQNHPAYTLHITTIITLH